MKTVYRAKFSYPTAGPHEKFWHSYGPERDTRDGALADRPERPEETWGRRTGIQTRQVTEWTDE